MGVTRFGLQIPSFTYAGVADSDLFDRVADDRGGGRGVGLRLGLGDGPLLPDQGVGPRTDPMLEAYTLLGGIAARTRRASLGTMVTGVTYRNPALLAKEVTTLDVVSGGRAILGIGAAWNEDEHAGYGFDFPPVRERMDRLEEALQICRAMFAEERPSFSGRHYTDHRGPELAAADSSRGDPDPGRRWRRAADARGSWPGTRMPATSSATSATVRHKLEVLERHCETVGRDPADDHQDTPRRPAS